MSDNESPDWAGPDFTARPEPEEKSIQQLVMEDLAEREQFGIRRYGRAIFADTPDDPIEGGPIGQAYREALDMTIYLRWFIERFGTGANLLNMPEIVTLCGSTRFADLYHQINLEQTIYGRIVLSIGCDRHSDSDLSLLNYMEVDIEDAKPALDELHKRKIDLSSFIIVISDDTGYIGESTRSEIKYAFDHGKRVEWLSIRAERNYHNQ
jgi:hypothetical protein